MLEKEIKPTLLKKLKKLHNKDKKSYNNVLRKINEIINSDEITIEHYKNLKSPLNHLKRVHVNDSYVLLFKYYKEDRKVSFIDYEHHDKVYFKGKKNV